MNDLDTRLRHLRLSGMAETLDARNREAITHHLAHVDFLELLVEDELTRRRDRLTQRRIKAAGLPQLKTLADFDWAFNRSVPKPLILDLATVRFVRERTGVLLVGPPGVGKSHICLSLALAAINAGHTVRYRSAFDLAEDLAEAEATGTRRDLVRALTRVDLLCLDDLGMRELPPTAAEDFLELITRRYEVGATIIYVIWNIVVVVLSGEEGARGRNPSLWTRGTRWSERKILATASGPGSGPRSRAIPTRWPGCRCRRTWAWPREPWRRTGVALPTI